MGSLIDYIFRNCEAFSETANLFSNDSIFSKGVSSSSLPSRNSVSGLEICNFLKFWEAAEIGLSLCRFSLAIQHKGT